MSHSPGPWHVGMRPGPIVYGRNGEQIADMRFVGVPKDEHLANINVILAAPDMLEVLERIVLRCATPDNSCRCAPNAEDIDDARVAIAKARGKYISARMG